MLAVSREHPLRNCSACEVAFRPGHGNQKYCSLCDRRRACANTTGRSACGECGAPMGEGSKWRGGRLCADCLETSREARRDEAAADIERLWAEGISMREMAERLGYSAGFMSVKINRLRRAGYRLPYRQANPNAVFPGQEAIQ